ncbi:MAG: DUF1800 family protein [Flavobacteriales bacterium]
MSKPLNVSELKSSSPKELLKRYPKLEPFKTAAQPSTQTMAVAPAPPPTSGLEPYSGEWTQREAKHLVNRTLFGANREKISHALDQGLEASVTELLADYNLPEPPLNTLAEFSVPIGETWVDAHLEDVSQVVTRAVSLYSWTNGLILNQSFSIREKMTLFWHDHFSTQSDVIEDPRFIYKHISLLRENALGNYKELCKKITVDPAMLRFLNGNQNFNVAPNENYARELLELFSIGKGPQAGPGDYTNYTEDDIAAAARVLTGWIDLGFGSLTPGEEIGSAFFDIAHDLEPKQFSERFNNTIINNQGEDEYSALIDMIFQQDACASFICRKLYRFFVHYIIDDSVETNMIQPMADILIANDYDITPVLEALFKSAHFYDAEVVGCMIKNPLDFILGMLNQFDVQISDEDVVQQYATWTGLAFAIPLLQMDYYNPPSVAGWQAYYQAPTYYRKWINSVTLPIRMVIAPALIFEGLDIEGETIFIDTLEFVNSMPEPSDVNELITDVTDFLYARPATASQKIYLKQFLLQGLPDFEWNVEYTNYLDDPEDEDLTNSVRNKTNLFLYGCLTLPEAFVA